MLLLLDLGTNMNTNTRGFTLIELMIVVVIIGILSSIAIPKFSSVKNQANQAACRSNLRSIAGAEMIYYARYSTFSDLHGLENSQALMNASLIECPTANAVYNVVFNQVVYVISCPNADPFHGSITDGIASW
jgi:prepilin-type N-terminal cleavage/methylation domain-containing protein